MNIVAVSVALTCVALLVEGVNKKKTREAKGNDLEEAVKLPNRCEVCKFLALELTGAFEKTGKSRAMLDTNYRFLDGKGTRVKYRYSETRFIDATENICNQLLQYNVHKERDGSNRFAKGMSETFQTLHGLVHKGVKVVMDIPYELWNETSAEVADLKKQVLEWRNAI